MARRLGDVGVDIAPVPLKGDIGGDVKGEEPPKGAISDLRALRRTGVRGDGRWLVSCNNPGVKELSKELPKEPRPEVLTEGEAGGMHCLISSSVGGGVGRVSRSPWTCECMPDALGLTFESPLGPQPGGVHRTSDLGRRC